MKDYYKQASSQLTFSFVGLLGILQQQPTSLNLPQEVLERTVLVKGVTSVISNEQLLDSLSHCGPLSLLSCDRSVLKQLLRGLLAERF